MSPPPLHPGAIQGKEGIKFCHLVTLRAAPPPPGSRRDRRRGRHLRPLGRLQGVGRAQDQVGNDTINLTRLQGTVNTGYIVYVPP